MAISVQDNMSFCIPSPVYFTDAEISKFTPSGYSTDADVVIGIMKTLSDNLGYTDVSGCYTDMVFVPPSALSNLNTKGRLPQSGIIYHLACGGMHDSDYPSNTLIPTGNDISDATERIIKGGGLFISNSYKASTDRGVYIDCLYYLTCGVVFRLHMCHTSSGTISRPSHSLTNTDTYVTINGLSVFQFYTSTGSSPIYEQCGFS